MANTLTNLTDTIILDKALEAFTAVLAPLTAFSINASPAAAAKGDKVKVLVTSAQDAAEDFDAEDGYLMQDADAEGVDVSLNKHKYVSWALTDTELSTQPQLSIEQFGRQKGFQLAKKVITDIWSVVTAANYGTAAFTGAASTFDSDDVVDIRSACSAADWPLAMRSLILDDAYYARLLKDTAIKDAGASGTTDPIREGSVRRLLGFDIFESTVIPGNSENLVGFAAFPDAIAVAMRYLSPQEGNKYFQAAPVTDEQTGLTIGFRDWYDENAGTRKKVMECVYGFQKTNGDAIKRLVSA